MAAACVHTGAVLLVGWNVGGARPAFAGSCSPYLEQCAISACLVAMQELASREENRAIVYHLELYEHPNSARATKVFGKGSLTLVCLSTRVNNIKKDNATVIKVESGSECWSLWAHPTTTTPFDAKGKAVDHPFVVPYWYVDTNGTMDGNMQMTTAVVDVGQFKVHVPIMQNVVKLGKHDTLQLKTAAEAEPKKSEGSEQKKRKVA